MTSNDTSTQIHLSPKDLSARWRDQISTGTLANWRSQGIGPAYVKLGTKVLYPLPDVEAFEAAGRRGPAPSNDNGEAGK